jgi:hypothetical protein
VRVLRGLVRAAKKLLDRSQYIGWRSPGAVAGLHDKCMTREPNPALCEALRNTLTATDCPDRRGSNDAHRLGSRSEGAVPVVVDAYNHLCTSEPRNQALALCDGAREPDIGRNQDRKALGISS